MENKYIDSEKLIAEINNRLMSVNLEELRNFGCHRVWAYNDVKDLIASLRKERPEVDLDEEIGRWMDKLDDKYCMLVENYSIQDIKDTARYFYELGQNERKKEQI